MSIQKTCPYCGGRGYITHIEALPDCGRAWTKRCIACEGTGLILYTETNADHIRAMSDEELANFLDAIHDFVEDGGGKIVDGNVIYPGNMLDWLEQPAEEDT